MQKEGVKELVIHEVGLRDGLQIEARTVPTDQKVSWAEGMIAAGVDIIQLGSFVHPEKVPQMADTDRLFAHFLGTGRKREGVMFSGLVLNEKGLERGFHCGVQMFCMGVSASETHSRKNTGMTTAEAADRIIAMASEVLRAGRRLQVCVQSAFGCGYEGAVPEDRVVGLAERFLAAGIRNLSLADTAGHADPEQVERLFAKLHALGNGFDCACHMHNTYGMGLANCCAAIRAGVRYFESSVAGLGGCPFTKVAGGNICTEDLVHYLQRTGRRRDIDLGRLIETARSLSAFFGREMPGMVYKSGPIPMQSSNS